MNRRSAVAAALGSAGAIAGINRLLRSRATPLGPPLGPETGTYRWRGIDVAYTESGDPEAQDVVLLHDIHPAGTSREFVRIFDDLAEDHHVIAPDFPGFGRSGRPPLQYNARLLESFVDEFIADLTETPVVIASGLAGAYAVSRTDRDKFSQLLLVCPTATVTSSRGRRFAGTVSRLPLVGTAITNGLTTKRGLGRTLGKQRLFDPNALDEDDWRYLWQTAHQPGARYAIASLVAGRLDSSVDLGGQLEASATPTSLLWGRAARTPSLADGRSLAEDVNAKLVVIDRCQTWPHYEQSDAFVSLLEDELATIADN